MFLRALLFELCYVIVQCALSFGAESFVAIQKFKY